MNSSLLKKLWRMAKDKVLSKLVGLAISAAILFLLYRKLDHQAIWGVLKSADRMWLFISVGMIVPITLANAARFRWVASWNNNSPTYTDSVAMTVVSIAMNLLLPAKLGDLTKSHFLYRRQSAPAGVAISVIVFERLCDAFAVASWCLLAWVSGLAEANLDAVVLPALALWLLSGIFLFTGSAASELLQRIRQLRLFCGREKLTSLAQGWPDLHQSLGSRSKWLVLFSIGLWLLHLTQIWMFTLAVGAAVPYVSGLVLSPVVLLCGLVPFTFGGIGTRDAAMIYLFAAYMSPESAAAAGLLTISRSLVPSIAAIPFLGRYLKAVLDAPATQEADR